MSERLLDALSLPFPPSPHLTICSVLYWRFG